MEVQTENTGIQVPLKDFLFEWGDVLGQKVIDSVAPVYNPLAPEGVEQFEEKLERLKRPLFPSQAEVAKALAKGFYVKGKQSLILCGEMGTGKTTIGASVAYLSRTPQRVIVMCPPHLVNKWQREIKKVIPDATVEDLNGRDVISKLLFLLATRAGTRPQRHEFYVFSRERAKASYFWEAAYNRARNDRHYLHCPQCGGKITETTDEGIFPLSSDRLAKKKHFCDSVIGYRVTVKGEGDEKVVKYRRAPLSYHALEGEELEEIKCGGALWKASPKLRRFAPVEFIKKYLPDFYDMGIFDECHEFKSNDSNQGIAFGILSSCVKNSLSLTGTLMGGYADDIFPILFRIASGTVKADGFNYGEDTAWMRRYGVLEEIKYIDEEDNKSGKGKKGSKIVKRRPGMSPEVLAKHLLDKTVFIKLADVAEGLPPYEEEVVTLQMEGEQKVNYQEFQDDLKRAIRQHRGDSRLKSQMLQALLAYPDSCMLRGEEVYVTPRINVNGRWVRANEPELVASAPRIEGPLTTPKEAELLDIVRNERKNGRRVLVYCTFTDSRDMTGRLSGKLEEAGFRTVVLRSSVPPLEREAWIAERVKEGADVVICNPELVKTGLDLYEFPTIVFYQTGYVIPTLRQASRRSWRIGQEKPVRVIFLTYADSMQSEALKLIAAKLETALAVEGELTDAGLAALSRIGSSLLDDMANSLASGGIKGGAEEAWARFRKREVEVELGLGTEKRTVPPRVVDIQKKIAGGGKVSTEIEALAKDRTIKVEIIESGRPRKKKTARIEVTAKDLDEVLSARTGAVQFTMF